MIRRRSGFSLVELMLACAVMAVVAGFGLWSLRGGKVSADSKGLASEISEEFKAARAKAIATGEPVAIGFPGSSSVLSQSAYQLEGTSRPRVTRLMRYSGSYPGSVFFWGWWGNATLSSNQDLNGTDFEFTEWAPSWSTSAQAEDYVLVFTPSGTVASNGLPLFDGEYRLIVSSGLEPGGAGDSSKLTLMTPARVAKAYTVSISETGAVSVSPGVKDLPNIPSDLEIAVGTIAENLPSPSSNDLEPKVLKLWTEPAPTTEDGEPSIVFVPENGYITVFATASDESGDNLYVHWEASGGTFSYKEDTEMKWEPDPDTGEMRWISAWVWTPPADAIGSDVYNLTCTISDGEHEVQGALEAGLSVRVVSPDKLAVISTDEWWENYFVAWMSPKGTHVKEVTLQTPAWEQLTPVWSPNGKKMAFYSGKFLGNNYSGPFEATLFLVHEDGTVLKEVFKCRGDITDYMFGPSFSPDGAHVAFSAYYDQWEAGSRVRAIRTYGDPMPQKVSDETGNEGNLDIEHTDVAWHPKNDYIMYRSENTATNETQIRVCKFIPQEISNAANEDWVVASSGVNQPKLGAAHWSRGGARICYTKGRKVFVQRMTNGRAVDDSDNVISNVNQINDFAKDVTPPGAPNFEGYYPRFSPDQSKLAVINTANWMYWEIWIIDLNGDGSYHSAFKLTDKHSVGDVFGFNWSPSGNKLVIASWDDTEKWDGIGDLFVIDAQQGAKPKKITPEGFDMYTTPDWWSPGDPNDS